MNLTKPFIFITLAQLLLMFTSQHHAISATLCGRLLLNKTPVGDTVITLYDETGTFLARTTSQPDGSFTVSYPAGDATVDISSPPSIKASASKIGPHAWRVHLSGDKSESFFLTVYASLRKYWLILGPIFGGLTGAFLAYLASRLSKKVDNAKKRRNFLRVYFQPLESQMRSVFLEIKGLVKEKRLGQFASNYAKTSLDLSLDIKDLIDQSQNILIECDPDSLIRLRDYYKAFQYLAEFLNSPRDHQGLLESCSYLKEQLPLLYNSIKSIEKLLSNRPACN